MTSRRDFLKASAATVVLAGCGASAAGTTAGAAPSPSTTTAAGNAGDAGRGDASIEDLCNEALQAARDAGASYADARIGRYRRQAIATRERQVTGVVDTESYGIGVRTLVNGAWGFAATSDLSRAGVQGAALSQGDQPFGIGFQPADLAAHQAQPPNHQPQLEPPDHIVIRSANFS